MIAQRLLALASSVAGGEKDIEKGAVGFNGYGFIFRDPLKSKDPYITFEGSSKFCTFSFYREIGTKWDSNSLIAELEYDIYLAGCLKTLVPTLQMGGDERLFFSWMFVKTPDGRQFPATFYYGQSGTALGGWNSYKDDSGESIFPKDFERVINFNPFKFTHEELGLLVNSLEQALRKVLISDFYGVYTHDLGQTLMGVKFGKPFFRELYRPMTDEEVRGIYDLTIV